MTIPMLADDQSRNTLILSGTAVMALISLVGYAIKRLYEDNQKAKAAHIEAEKSRADEANERADALQKLLNEHREGKP